MTERKWPYENRMHRRTDVSCDVLVLGGGLSGCFAAIAAREAGMDTVLVEKGTLIHSGAAGTGIDHWENACTNPCCTVTPEEMAYAYIDEQDHYSNGIAHYIECRESFDRLLDLESYGAKIRDEDDEFKGAPFRDEKTKFLYAYDYASRYTMRIWGTTFKPALLKRLKELGVRLYERCEAASLLTEGEGENRRGIGAICMDTHTAEIFVIHAKTTVLAMSRPARVWLYNPDMTGLSEFRPPQCIGSGHAMGLRAGVRFTMMEKSVRGEFSAAGRSFPPYSTGNNHNTWYAATMVDARGVEIPYLDRDGNELTSVEARYYPVKGQKFFLKGGAIDEPKYEYRGPETMPFDELIRRGYRLPFYADLSSMPEYERKAIWGLMVGEEGKTRIPVYQNLNSRGFDPEKHLLQSYGTGWQSASFLPQERQLFGAPGGIITDWDLKTTVDGIYACGDQLFGMDCAGAACATGHYAGRHAAAAAKNMETGRADEAQIEEEIRRLYAPLENEDGMDWRELNMAIAKAMQNYCGGLKNDELLKEGISLLESYRRKAVPQLYAANPHELMRTHEVLDILDVAEMILHACLMRRFNSRPLCFERTDTDVYDPEDDRRFITIGKENGIYTQGEVQLDYYGDLKENYERHNRKDGSE